MKQKFETLYHGIHTNKLQALIYKSIFCVRRFNIVLVNIIFSPGFPFTSFKQNPFLIKIFFILLIQTIYAKYVWNIKPHTKDIYNQLELFNEGMIVLMCYMMISYSGIAPIEYVLDSNVALWISIAMTASIVIANFWVMFKVTYKKVA